MYRIRIPDDVVMFVRHMHPRLKTLIRTSLEALIQDPYCGKSLKDELAGLRSLRVKRFRIIYRLTSTKSIEIIAIGPRRYIYEETYRMIRRDKTAPADIED